MEEGVHERARQFRADYPRAEDQNVHVVMFHSLVGGVRVMTEAGADTGQLVGRDRGSYAAATDEDSAIGAPLLQGHADGFGVIGIIHRRRAMCANVEHLLSSIAQVSGQDLFRFPRRTVLIREPAAPLIYSFPLAIKAVILSARI